MFRLGRERVNIFAIDETRITIAGMSAFLFIAYEPFEGRILGLHFSWTPNSIAVEMFLRDLCRKYGRHPVWTDGAEWYSLACESMNLKHHVYVHGSWLWEVTERAVQRLKDITESFDDLFPCKSHGERCKLRHVQNWIGVFFLHHQPLCTNHSSRRSNTSLSKRSKDYPRYQLKGRTAGRRRIFHWWGLAGKVEQCWVGKCKSWCSERNRLVDRCTYCV